MCRIYGFGHYGGKYTFSSTFVDAETDIFQYGAVNCQGKVMQKRYRKRRQRRIGIALLIASAIVVIALVIVFCSRCGGKAPADPSIEAMAPAQTPSAATVETPSTAQPVAAVETRPAATETPVAAPATPTPVPTQRPWDEPCVSEYDYQYEDATRYIHIDRVEENGTTYFVADVQLQSASQFGTWFAGDAYGGRDEPLSSMARKAGAVFAVNADNYNAHEYGVIIRDGVLYRTRETTRNMLIVDKNGDFSVRVDRADDDPEAVGAELVAQGVLHTFEFGPELVRDGVAVEFDPDFNVIATHDTRREPRTAIGQIGPLHYVVIVADGRQDGYSRGLTLQELQQLFVRYGAQTAMNLDGGGTAEMWLCGEILNRPSGGRERSMSDIIWF